MENMKFRVWNGMEMVYDAMVGKFGIFYVNPSNNGIDENDSACLTPANTKYPDDIPVMQYTGLKDKNGVEIYEGDILKIDEGHPVEVRYEKIYASFGIWRKGWAFLHYFHEAVEPKDCEVIGNIHDKNKQKRALIDSMRGDEEIGLYNDNPKNHGYER